MDKLLLQMDVSYAKMIVNHVLIQKKVYVHHVLIISHSFLMENAVK